MSSRRKIINEICCAETLYESMNIFEENKDLISDCKFIFSAQDGANIPSCTVKKVFKNGAGVHNVFATEKIIALDEYIISEMKRKGTVDYIIDYSISLDNNIVNYIRSFINNENKHPKEFDDIFKFLIQKSVNVDSMPYMLENIKEVNDQSKIDPIYETLKCYEILKTVDEKKYENDGVISSKCSISEINNNALKNLESMIEISRDKNPRENLNLQKILYCILLKIVDVQIHYPNKSIEYRLDKFLEFCDSILHTIFLRELVIAREYFKKVNNLRFFGKIQKNNNNKLSNLKNMSWDLFHIRQMETRVMMRPEGNARYFFPAFLTNDLGLIEIIELFPIKAIGFSDNANELSCSFKVGDFLEKLDTNDFDEKMVISKRYLNNINYKKIS